MDESHTARMRLQRTMPLYKRAKSDDGACTPPPLPVSVVESTPPGGSLKSRTSFAARAPVGLFSPSRLFATTRVCTYARKYLTQS